MKYFTEKTYDIEGYVKNLEKLKDLLDRKTYSFILQDSFHDSEIRKISVLNKIETERTKKSPVSVLIELTHPNQNNYALLWEDVSKYSTDFDNSRIKVTNSDQHLIERDLDQWSHDELIQNKEGCLRHEIILFSKTRLLIECKDFSIINLSK